MNKKNVFPLILIVVLLAACGTTPEKQAKKIGELEDRLFAEDAGMIDEAGTLELVNTYVEYADGFPEDTAAASYLFKAADISMNLLDPKRSITLFDRIMSDYPDFEKIPHCLFLKGYIYENDLHDLEKAKSLYLVFLEKYPDHEFADDVQISIEHLGKTPEQLIMEFQARAEAEAAGDSIQ